MSALARRLAVARGDEPADLVVRGGTVLSVFTREWLEADVAIVDGFIAGLGSYEGREEIDAAGRYVVPGLIDSHMHIESTKLLPDELARLILPLGTTAIVADPHEIANVLGTDGVHWLHDASAGLQLEVFFMASSCVPASVFESPRRPLELGDLEALMRRKRVLGLAEMMNFPGVIAGDDTELAKLALEGAEHVDGHAPGVLGKALQAYAASGIRSDHEMLTVEEGRERLRAGVWLLIREASMARNLQALLPLVREYGPNRIAFCTDDRDPEDIADNGHVNGMVRDAVARNRPGGRDPDGVLPSRALARAHGPRSRRARFRRRPPAPARSRDVPPGPRTQARPAHRRRAHGRGARVGAADRPAQAGDRCRLRDPLGRRLGTRDRTDHGSGRDRVARGRPARRRRARGLRPGTRSRQARRRRAPSRHGAHRMGLVSGSGLQRGALASTVAHDAHNLVVVGADDEDMAAAANRLAEVGGGIVVVDGGRVVAECPLPVAGLLSDQPLDIVVSQSRGCNDAAQELGWVGATPFLTLAFLALSVIPSLKLTDRGLVDVDRFEIVPLAAVEPAGTPRS